MIEDNSNLPLLSENFIRGRTLYPSTFEKGKKEYADGKVTAPVFSEDGKRFSAVVKGDKESKVSFVFSDGKIKKSDCGCGFHHSHGGLCEHEVAALFYLLNNVAQNALAGLNQKIDYARQDGDTPYGNLSGNPYTNDTYKEYHSEGQKKRLSPWWTFVTIFVLLALVGLLLYGAYFLIR